MVRCRQSIAPVDRLPTGDGWRSSVMCPEPFETADGFGDEPMMQRRLADTPCSVGAMAMAWRWTRVVCEQHIPKETTTPCVILHTTRPFIRCTLECVLHKIFARHTHSLWWVWSELTYMSLTRQDYIDMHNRLFYNAAFYLLKRTACWFILRKWFRWQTQGEYWFERSIFRFLRISRGRSRGPALNIIVMYWHGYYDDIKLLYRWISI